MKAQELKNSILQLTVQGKLVPQDPSEAPASELLKEINTEKERLVKEGKLKKDKALVPIAEEDIPFEIPESWEWLKIGEICQIIDGEKQSGKNYPYLEAKYLRGKIEATTYSEGKFIREGTRIILVDGENSGEVFTATEDGYMGSTFKVLFIPTSLFADYVLIFLLLRKQQFRNNKTGSAIPHLNKELFFNMPIPIPPLDEQKRIVARIEELLPLVAEYDAAESRLSELNSVFPDKLRKSILQQAIQGKLTERDPADEPASELLKRIIGEKERLIKEGKLKKEKPLPSIAEDEIPFEIPENWVWVRFSVLMNMMSTGPFGSMLHKSDYVDKGIPLVNPANIVDGVIVPSDKMMISEKTRERLSSYVLHKGMLVMGRRGEMGRCALVTEIEDGWLCGTGSFFMQPNSYLFFQYISLFFSSPYAKQYLGGKSVGTTMNNLNHKILSSMPVPLPPLAEQARIVARVDELLALCDRLK